METNFQINKPNFYFKENTQSPVDEKANTLNKQDDKSGTKKTWMILGGLAVAGAAFVAISRGKAGEAIDKIKSSAQEVTLSPEAQELKEQAGKIAGEVADKIKQGAAKIEANPVVQSVIATGKSVISQVQQNPTVQKGIKGAQDLAEEASLGLEEVVQSVRRSSTFKKGIKGAKKFVRQGKKTFSRIKRNPSVKKGVEAVKNGAEKLGEIAEGVTSIIEIIH